MSVISQLMHDLITFALLDNSLIFLAIVIVFKLMYGYTAQKYIMSVIIMISMMGVYLKFDHLGFAIIIPHALVLYMYIRRYICIQSVEQSIRDFRLEGKSTSALEKRLVDNQKELVVIEPKLNKWVWVAIIFNVILLIMEY